MSFVGVDGCSSGWFGVCLTNSGEWETGIEPNFGRIWTRWHAADSILVDIPIGLRDSGNEERLCDREARRALGPPRSSSVFPVPCRPSLQAEGYPDACRINKRYTGRRLSQQSWNIAGKIREVDDLLQSHPRARSVVREIHPEVLFWALNGGKSMQHNKRTEDGFKERLQLLELRNPGSEVIVTSVLNRFARKEIERDDLMDALAAAVTGKLGKGSLRSFPEWPERDSTGLPMEIVYHRC
jgi:predicted RNase H-like nuclease